MTIDEVLERVARSARYRRVDQQLVRRLAEEEGRRGGRPDEIVKRVKRRLHQAVGAFGQTGRLERELARIEAAWDGDPGSPAFRDACLRLLATHASTRERAAHLEPFYSAVWAARGGSPSSVLDLGCGLAPLALPWMGLPGVATYHARDADEGSVAAVATFLDLVGQPHSAVACDLVGLPDLPPAEVALLLKLIPTLDRQDPDAAARLLGALDCSQAVVSFPRRSLGGRGKGMEATYRGRLERLVADVERVRAMAVAVAEASVPSELVFVLELGRA